MPDPITVTALAATAAQVATHDSSQKISVIIASIIGGVLSLKFVDKMTSKQKGFSILSGAVMAHELTPIISHFYASDAYSESIGFLIGLFGMSVCSTIFAKIRRGNLLGFIGNSELPVTVDNPDGQNVER